MYLVSVIHDEHWMALDGIYFACTSHRICWLTEIRAETLPLNFSHEGLNEGVAYPNTYISVV